MYFRTIFKNQIRQLKIMQKIHDADKISEKVLCIILSENNIFLFFKILASQFSSFNQKRNSCDHVFCHLQAWYYAQSECMILQSCLSKVYFITVFFIIILEKLHLFIQDSCSHEIEIRWDCSVKIHFLITILFINFSKNLIFLSKFTFT